MSCAVPCTTRSGGITRPGAMSRGLNARPMDSSWGRRSAGRAGVYSDKVYCPRCGGPSGYGCVSGRKSISINIRVQISMQSRFLPMPNPLHDRSRAIEPQFRFWYCVHVEEVGVCARSGLRLAFNVLVRADERESTLLAGESDKRARARGRHEPILPIWERPDRHLFNAVTLVSATGEVCGQTVF